MSVSAPTAVASDERGRRRLTFADRWRGAVAAHRARTGHVTGPVAAMLKYVTLVAASVIAVVPLVTLFFASLKTKAEFAATGPLDPPANWLNFSNYATVIVKGELLMAFFNTAVILGVALVGTIFLGTMTAYAIDRFGFRGRGVVMSLFLAAALVPAVTTQVATFKIINVLGVFNTRWSVILLFLGTDIIAIQIFIQFMSSISRSLDEAAMLDGANRFRIYRSVILPLLKPAIATVVIIKGIAIYNEFYMPFLYMPGENLGVLSTALYRFKGPQGSDWELIAACTIIVIVPTLVAFLALQRHIYSGLTSGATK
ncbi:carbohydrate ABC transporter permease [Sanguibacter sp. A247]|uniref:carbohydrate ABC transporter permease n=1 Tax=unclassified Sanguibacter TaxID=2645534 RepID=UPI003FD80506